RGYTVWDTSSYAFIKDGTLCIPTAYCSYSGEALDKKTPLLRSMEALDWQALRILRLFGNKAVERVTATVGAEQEYFLVDRELYLKRPDLVLTGRTLFGARPPKGQELDDHYYVSLTPRVSAFMKELEEELWKLGVCAKTKHNETAPAQRELAVVFSTANIAADQNQLTMELMKSIATKHGLVCLLHEKPFAHVNGSGKHNNWSLSTDTGVNLLDPGKTPYENAQFLLFLVAVMKAADDYQDLLRVSTASAGNDHRLGANEAPPAIVSMFLGDELTEILEALESGADYSNTRDNSVEIGVSVLPNFPKDSTDRNRTSPLAFTGNKFEFRMLGSAFSISDPNVVLNTAVAEVLRQFADELESAKDFKNELAALIKRTFSEHKRIIFNGNNYSDEWVQEAKRRGLSNLRNSVDAFPVLLSGKAIELFAQHSIFSESELYARCEILTEEYCKTVHIEALTMVDIAFGEIIPACVDYQNDLAKLLARKKAGKGAFGHDIDTSLEVTMLNGIATRSACLLERLDALESTIAQVKQESQLTERAKYYSGNILPAMEALRNMTDELEMKVAKKHWPLPSYAQIFYSVE
ncbi:MAG: glutamine synthetase III, partial [Defluviitaleaceae bacterium]|nr:glutamine synthetase III [Defluviitaleaceae bacterium]